MRFESERGQNEKENVLQKNVLSLLLFFDWLFGFAFQR
jgi:hypothetical protein